MSEQELFSVPVVNSPRLKWMAKYCVKTRKADHDVAEGEEDEFGNRVSQWVAWQYNQNPPPSACGGATEDDALAAWARANGVRMWFEEGV